MYYQNTDYFPLHLVFESIVYLPEFVKGDWIILVKVSLLDCTFNDALQLLLCHLHPQHWPQHLQVIVPECSLFDLFHFAYFIIRPIMGFYIFMQMKVSLIHLTFPPLSTRGCSIGKNVFITVIAEITTWSQCLTRLLMDNINKFFVS